MGRKGGQGPCGFSPRPSVRASEARATAAFVARTGAEVAAVRGATAAVFGARGGARGVRRPWRGWRAAKQALPSFGPRTSGEKENGFSFNKLE